MTSWGYQTAFLRNIYMRDNHSLVSADLVQVTEAQTSCANETEGGHTANEGVKSRLVFFVPKAQTFLRPVAQIDLDLFFNTLLFF